MKWKDIRLMKWTVHIVFTMLLFCSFSWAEQPPKVVIKQDGISVNIAKIEQYYQMGKELVSYPELIVLSTKILPERHLYPTNTLAKVYALLADAATSKSDMAKAFQFANDGLSLAHIDIPLQLNFLQKLAEGYYVNGQFKKTLTVTNQILVVSQLPEHIKYRLIALGYRAMAYALLAEHELANVDLMHVTELIQMNDFSEHVEILNILSLAYHHLGDFETAVKLQNQLIELKLASSNFYNLDQNYFSLAKGYEALGRYDDAYNAFWDAQKIAEEKSALILQGYIQLGLGKMLLAQKKYPNSYKRLVKAESFFIGQNQSNPYLSVLIYLAEAAQYNNRAAEAEEVLLRAEKLAANIELTKSQISLYHQLYLLYQHKQNYKKSLFYLNRYLELYQHFNPERVVKSEHKLTVDSSNDSSQALASRLVTDGQLKNSFEDKFSLQRKVIILLTIFIFILLLFAVVLWLKNRNLRLVAQYNDIERPADFLHNSHQTKNLYQLNYKKARKYDYPLAVGYIIVDNWKELSFKSNKKVRAEVSRAIAILINQSIGEFDCVGMLNEGEYLLMCPHQYHEDIAKKLEKLTAALEVNYFANLGGFTVSIGYAFDMPSVQDIDPYIFLSRLSERVSSKFSK